VGLAGSGIDSATLPFYLFYAGEPPKPSPTDFITKLVTYEYKMVADSEQIALCQIITPQGTMSDKG